MEITLNVDGKEIRATINDEEWEKLNSQAKKTGYERVKMNDVFYFQRWRGDLGSSTDPHFEGEDETFENANYYSDEQVAENNIRADRLMRQLRRFAVEHEGCLSKKTAESTESVCIIGNDRKTNEPRVCKILNDWTYDHFKFPVGMIAFYSEQAVNEAIKEFHDELVWYFTEYDPMPEGYWEDSL